MSPRLLCSVVALAVLTAPQLAAAAPLKGTPAAKPTCTRVVAENETTLAFVGVVAQGRKRAVFLMPHRESLDPKTVAYLVWPGECAGRDHVPFEQLFRANFNDGLVRSAVDVASR